MNVYIATPRIDRKNDRYFADLSNSTLHVEGDDIR